MSIGTTEIIVIFIVALVVLGPEKMPYYASKAAKGLKQLKTYTNEFTKEIQSNVIEPLSEVSEPLSEMKNEIIQPIEEIKSSLNKPQI